MWVWVWGPMSKRHVACTCIIMCIGGRWMDVGVGLGTNVKRHVACTYVNMHNNIGGRWMDVGLGFGPCGMYMCQYA